MGTSISSPSLTQVAPDSGDGANLGISPNSKLSAYGKNPAIIQPILATGASHTVDDVITVLQNLGWVRQS